MHRSRWRKDSVVAADQRIDIPPVGKQLCNDRLTEHRVCSCDNDPTIFRWMHTGDGCAVVFIMCRQCDADAAIAAGSLSERRIARDRRSFDNCDSCSSPPGDAGVADSVG